MKILTITLVALCLMPVTISFSLEETLFDTEFDALDAAFFYSDLDEPGVCSSIPSIEERQKNYIKIKTTPRAYAWCEGGNVDGHGCLCSQGKHLKQLAEGICFNGLKNPVTWTHWRCANDNDSCPPDNEMNKYQENTPGYKVWCDGADAHFDGHACSCLNGKKLKKIFDGQCDGVTMMHWQCK